MRSLYSFSDRSFLRLQQQHLVSFSAMGASLLSSFHICCTCLTIPLMGICLQEHYIPRQGILQGQISLLRNFHVIPYFYNKSMQAVSCPSGFLPKKIKERTSCSSYKFANYNRELLLGVILTGLAVCAVIFVSATIMFKGSTFSFSGFLFTLNMLCLI